MARRSALYLVFPALVACAADFEPASTVNSVRVLAVQKDKPYARPGETVHLDMLVSDSSPKPRPLQITWLGGFCENPLGDSYLGCFANLGGKTTGPLGLPEGVVIGQGPTFSVPVTSTIISKRPPPANRRQPPYGTSFVFFTACAGHIDAAPPDEIAAHQFPIACYDDKKNRIGNDGFVAGYSEIFAYDKFRNENPIVTGFEVDGQTVTPDCIGVECVAQGIPLPPDAGAQDAGSSATTGAGSGSTSLEGGADGSAGDGSADASSPSSGKADAGHAPKPPPKAVDPCTQDSPACIDQCTEEKQDDCKPKHSIKLIVDQASVEHDSVQEQMQGATVYEQLWINYYTEQGKVPVEAKLLGDATAGYQEAHQTDLLPPKTAGVFHVWGVAHDNRGGTQWARITMSARPAP